MPESHWLTIKAAGAGRDNALIKRDALNALCLAALFVAALLLNDTVMEWRMRTLLSQYPQVLMNSGAQGQSQHPNASAMDMQQSLVAHWGILSQTRAYAVRFNGSRFTSRQVRIAEVATPQNLNLIATDYRCHYCRGDRGAITALIKAHPNRDFVFIEAPVLGPESVELAKEALLRAQNDESDYYSIHNRMFDSPAATLADEAHGNIELLTEQKRFIDTIGVFATPTYVLDGVFRLGTIGTSGG